MNVVLVSDEPVLAALARRPLEPLGVTVTAVASVAELERRLAELAPQVALLPRRLPDRSLDAAVALLRSGPQPIAAIVVGLVPADRRIAHDVDADGFLLVPFSDAELLEMLGATTRAKKLILLADDSPLIHRHTVPILEDDGYEVRSANDGTYVVDSFVSVQTKTVQAPDPLQSTATYSVTIDSKNGWQITDVGGVGSVLGQK